jgi:hypothetical protein
VSERRGFGVLYRYPNVVLLHLFSTQYQMNSHKTIKGLVDIVPFGCEVPRGGLPTPCRGVVDLKNRMQWWHAGRLAAAMKEWPLLGWGGGGGDHAVQTLLRMNDSIGYIAPST